MRSGDWIYEPNFDGDRALAPTGGCSFYKRDHIRSCRPNIETAVRRTSIGKASLGAVFENLITGSGNYFVDSDCRIQQGCGSSEQAEFYDRRGDEVSFSAFQRN
jgi:hypothetical protein